VNRKFGRIDAGEAALNVSRVLLGCLMSELAKRFWEAHGA
jgi:hypothetical protein